MTTEHAVEISKDVAEEIEQLSYEHECGQITKSELAEKTAEVIRQHIISYDLVLIKILRG